MWSNYYNEFAAHPAEWLLRLSSSGLIPPGVVDSRSIKDVRSPELRQFRQCHFFAGIGGWSRALHLVGWKNAPVWTGSCPCQPFSQAGDQRGFEDERHLWPVWFNLIRECLPPVIFGEQVASAAGLAWLDAVQSDLEGAGYAFGAADLCAAGVGAPHIRQRLYFGAVRLGHAHEHGVVRDPGAAHRAQAPLEYEAPGSTHRAVHGLGDDDDARRARSGHGQERAGLGEPVADGEARGLADDDDAGFGIVGREGLSAERDTPQRHDVDGRGATSFWEPCDWVPCRDGKLRPVEPGTFPLANGVPGRVGQLRGYGNAIVPQVAAEFITAFIASAREAGLM